MGAHLGAGAGRRHRRVGHARYVENQVGLRSTAHQERHGMRVSEQRIMNLESRMGDLVHVQILRWTGGALAQILILSCSISVALNIILPEPHVRTMN